VRSARIVLLVVLLAAVGGCGQEGSTYDASWALLQADPNSSIATVEYFHGNCDSLESVHTIRTPKTVTFRIQVHEDAQGCDLVEKVTAIRIRLGVELGDRTIVGACQDRNSDCAPPPAVRKTMDLHHLRTYGP
jgi:hypothetical protein